MICRSAQSAGEVQGSCPGLAGLSVGDVAQLGEHCLCKAGVAGSTPVVSTGESVLGRL